MSPEVLANIAKKHSIDAIPLKNFKQALKKVSSHQKKLICVFGSLYQCGNILNYN